MTHPTMPIEAARDALQKRNNGESWSCRPFVRHQGDGEHFEESRPERLLSRLLAIKDAIGKDPLPKNMAKDFESQSAEAVHQELALDTSTACSREFWLWLTFAAEAGQFLQFVDWRFGTQKSIAPVNYGIGRQSEIWEGLFARLWWRGQVGYDPALDDPYRMARRGDVDIWRSHIIRQEYGRCRNMALALLGFQYPTDDPGAGKLRISHLRELVKRLRVMDANIAYEVMDEPSLQELIRKNAEHAAREIP